MLLFKLIEKRIKELLNNDFAHFFVELLILKSPLLNWKLVYV